MLNDLGFHTLRTQMPPLTVFALRLAPKRAFAERLAAFLLASPQLLERPVVLYWFSNGGVFTYEQLIAAMAHAPERHQRVSSAWCGTVFDSSPCYVLLDKAADLFASSLAPHKLLRPPLRWAWRALIRLLSPLSGVATGIDAGPAFVARFWAGVGAANPFRKPELYLYSQCDELCDYRKLEELIALRKAQGVDVWCQRWEVSEHVGHLRRHGAQYVATLSSFLHRVAGSGEPLPPRKGTSSRLRLIAGGLAPFNPDGAAD